MNTIFNDIFFIFCILQNIVWRLILIVHRHITDFADVIGNLHIHKHFDRKMSLFSLNHINNIALIFMISNPLLECRKVRSEKLYIKDVIE